MSSNLIKFKKQATPGIIINNYPREFDLLNCVALKARYELRDIDIFHNNMVKKNMEMREQLISSKIEAEEEKEDEGWDNSNLLFELKMLAKSRNKIINFSDYLTPIEERQKKFFDYYKNVFMDMQKDGINYYTNKQIKNFLEIQNAQKRIQKKITKSKSVIIKSKFNKEGIEKELPLLKLSSIGDKKTNNNFLPDNKLKKVPLLKLSSYKEENNSIKGNSNQKLPYLKLFSFNDNDSNYSKNSYIEDKKINDYNTKINNDKEKNIFKMKKKKINKIKNLNKSCDDLDKKFLFDKNFNPVIDTSSFKILSKRGNIQFFNSIWRTKDINDCINPYAPNEVNSILKQLKQKRKKFY